MRKRESGLQSVGLGLGLCEERRREGGRSHGIDGLYDFCDSEAILPCW